MKIRKQPKAQHRLNGRIKDWPYQAEQLWCEEER